MVLLLFRRAELEFLFEIFGFLDFKFLDLHAVEISRRKLQSCFEFAHRHDSVIATRPFEKRKIFSISAISPALSM